MIYLTKGVWMCSKEFEFYNIFQQVLLAISVLNLRQGITGRTQITIPHPVNFTPEILKTVNHVAVLDILRTC